MNRLAAIPRRRSPTTAASLDLSDDAQKRIHALIQRFHGGRWPLFRCLSMRQVDGVIHEAVTWSRMHAPEFSVVTYRRDGMGLSWCDYPNKVAALTALRLL